MLQAYRGARHGLDHLVDIFCISFFISVFSRFSGRFFVGFSFPFLWFFVSIFSWFISTVFGFRSILSWISVPFLWVLIFRSFILELIFLFRFEFFSNSKFVQIQTNFCSDLNFVLKFWSNSKKNHIWKFDQIWNLSKSEFFSFMKIVHFKNLFKSKTFKIYKNKQISQKNSKTERTRT
jgi:hypothetical protein